MSSRLRISANGLVIAAVVAIASTVRATTLGNALSFGALGIGGKVSMAKNASLASGDVGAQSLTLAADASVSGDLIANPKGIKLAASATAHACVTAGAKVVLASGASCTSIDTSGSSPDLGLLATAVTDAKAFATAAQAQTATQALGVIKVRPNESQNITLASGLNVVTAKSIAVGSNATLTVMGGLSDTAIIVISGNLSVQADAVLTPNFSDAQLIFLVLGSHVSLAHDAVLNGTVLAPAATCTMAHDASSRGAYFCKSLSMAHDASVDTSPSTVSVP